VACLASSGARATIIGGAVTGGNSLTAKGVFKKLTPPLSNPHGATNSVGNDTFNDPNLYGFDENQNFIGAAPLHVDVSRNGLPGVIPARTEVASHYVFFDPVNTPHQIGYVDFDGEILAIITSRFNLISSDFLARTSVNYLSPTKRGLEADTDSARIDPNHPNRLLVNWAASSPGDYIRVLTVHSPPQREFWNTNGHYYEAVLAEGGISWTDANQIATGRGGHLVTIDSPAENEFVFNLVANPRFWVKGGTTWFGPWLGALQPPGSIEPSGGWIWETSEPFIYANWAPGQPTNSKETEDRIQFGGFTNISGYWNDLAGGDIGHASGFVVEYDSNLAPSLSIKGSLDGNAMITWRTRISVTYSLLQTDEIVSGTWTIVTNVFGTGADLTLTNRLNSQRKYYRLSY
jgi:hypothetical protein